MTKIPENERDGIFAVIYGSNQSVKDNIMRRAEKGCCKKEKNRLKEIL